MTTPGPKDYHASTRPITYTILTPCRFRRALYGPLESFPLVYWESGRPSMRFIVIKTTVLARGKDYPLPIIHGGSSANFLIRGGSILQIGLPGILRSEELAIRSGPMCGGFIHDGPYILWVFTFGNIILECPYDIRKVRRDLLALPDVKTAQTRLVIGVHLVDTLSNILRGLRYVTVPPDLTLNFLDAAQNQFCDLRSTAKQAARYESLPLADLPGLANIKLLST